MSLSLKPFVLGYKKKVDVTVNTKRFRHFAQCMFEVYFFMYRKDTSPQFSELHAEL